MTAWNPRRFLQQRRDRKAHERELAEARRAAEEAQRAAAWDEADERTRGARDWLLRLLERSAEDFDRIHELGPKVFPATGDPWRAAALRVAEMHPTDPLLVRLVALDDKGGGARTHGTLGYDDYFRSRGRLTTDILTAIIEDGERFWGQLPPGAEGEVPAWGYWGEDGKAVPMRRNRDLSERQRASSDKARDGRSVSSDEPATPLPGREAGPATPERVSWFAQLHGALVALTPQEQPQSDPASWQTDLGRVASVEDLPPRLLMGYRDDASFTRTSDGFVVGYALEGERVLELRLEGALFHWTQTWHGLDGGGGVGSAKELGIMVQHMPLFTAWQDVLEDELQAIGNFSWLSRRSGDLQIVGLPDGVLVQVAFPVNGQALPEIARFYEELWAEPTRSIHPIAHVLFGDLPVTHRWSPQAEPGAPKAWTSRFVDIYSRELGLGQVPPGEPRLESDGGASVTIYREGFLHVATLPLRDLLGYARRLVEHGLIADYRFEDDTLERDGWERATAPFRAIAAPLGSLVDTDVVFTDEGGMIECTYPTARSVRVHLDASTNNAFEGLTFERVNASARHFGEAIVSLDERLRVIRDEFMADPEAAARRVREQGP